MENEIWQNSGESVGEIACLGWGSLIWDQRELPVNGDWKADGPKIPVEFARQSADDHITLVIVESDHRVQTLWAEINVESLSEAIDALQAREGVPYRSSIGRWPNDTKMQFRSVM